MAQRVATQQRLQLAVGARRHQRTHCRQGGGRAGWQQGGRWGRRGGQPYTRPRPACPLESTLLDCRAQVQAAAAAAAAARCRSPIDPTLLPASTRGSMPCSSRAFTTPRWNAPSEPPPLRRGEGRRGRKLGWGPRACPLARHAGEQSRSRLHGQGWHAGGGRHEAVELLPAGGLLHTSGRAHTHTHTRAHTHAPEHQRCAAKGVPRLLQERRLLLKRQVWRGCRDGKSSSVQSRR